MIQKLNKVCNLKLTISLIIVVAALTGIGIGTYSFNHNHPQTPNVVAKVNDVLAHKDHTVVVFWLNGCPYCNKALPTIVKQANATTHTRTVFVEVNSDEGRHLAQQYHVTKVPAMMNINQGSAGEPKLVTTGSAATKTIKVRRSLIASYY